MRKGFFSMAINPCRWLCSVLDRPGEVLGPGRGEGSEVLLHPDLDPELFLRYFSLGPHARWRRQAGTGWRRRVGSRPSRCCTSVLAGV
jgi:hypothetical protein